MDLPAVQAQTLSGRVRGPSGEALEFATVSVHALPDSTVVKTEFSDAQGGFAFERLPANRYFVAISMVGYERHRSETLTLGPQTTVLPPIQLKPARSATLNEVTVQGRKPFIERALDRTIVNVDGSPLSAGATSLDVLIRAPGVTVDANDNLGLRGRQGVLVLLDGKRIPMTGTELADLLRATPASQLDKIELITNPSAKYDAAGSAGIISIKLKKDQRYGTNGSANASFGYGRYAKTTGGLSLNHRHKKLNLFGSYGYNARNVYTSLRFHRDFFQNNLKTGSTDQFNEGHTLYQSHTYRAGLDYTLSRRTLLGLVITGLGSPAVANIRNEAANYDAPGNVLARYTSANYRTLRMPNQSLNFNVKHSLDSAGRRELSADADLARYETHRIQNLATTFQQPVSPPATLAGNLNGALTIASVKADYNQPLGAMQLETGFKLSWVHSDNDVQFTNISEGRSELDTSKSNQFRYDEAIAAAYVNLSRSFGSFSVQAGLRGENTDVKGLQLVGNQGFDRRYFQLFPSVFFKNTFSKTHELSLSLSRRIDRPSYNQLNPFRAYIDATTYFSGNPALFPALNYNVELTHTFRQKWSTTLGYSRSDKPIVSVIQPAPEGNRQVVSTFQNLTRSDYYTLSLTLPFEPARWWTVYNNFVGYYGHFVGDLAGTTLNAGRPAFNLSSNSTFTLGAGWTAELNGRYQSRELYGFLDVRPQGQLSVGLQKSLWSKRGTLRLNLSDIFYTSPTNATSTYANYVEVFNQRQDTRVATASFSYRFGSDTVAPTRRRVGGAEEEKRRAGA